MIRKAVKYLCIFFVIVCSLHTVRDFFVPKQTTVQAVRQQDYTAAASIAEHATQLYLTYDSSPSRQKELSALMPSLTVPPEAAKGVSQSVDQARALLPSDIGNRRVRVPVDTWLTTSKPGADPVHRHVVVTFKVYFDQGVVSIDGLPSIAQAEKANASPPDPAPLASQDESKDIKLMLQSFLNDYFSATDQDSLKNGLASGATARPLGGLYQFRSIETAGIQKTSDNKYLADVKVNALDPLLSAPIQIRFMAAVVKDGDRFFVSSIGIQ